MANNQLEGILTDAIKKFSTSMFLETRLATSIYEQITEAPSGFYKALKFVEDNKADFHVIFKASYDDSSIVASSIEETNDSMKKMALWSKFLIENDYS